MNERNDSYYADELFATILSLCLVVFVVLSLSRSLSLSYTSSELYCLPSQCYTSFSIIAVAVIEEFAQ